MYFIFKIGETSLYLCWDNHRNSFILIPTKIGNVSVTNARYGAILK